MQLARDPARDGHGGGRCASAALVGITVTGLVHFVLLRPLLDLAGGNYLADTLLHIVVPVLAVVGWLVAGPRPRAPWRDALLALGWPVAWLGWTLLVGGLTGWYPYPFLDVGQEGAAPSRSPVSGSPCSSWRSSPSSSVSTAAWRRSRSARRPPTRATTPATAE